MMERKSIREGGGNDSCLENRLFKNSRSRNGREERISFNNIDK